MSNQQDDQPFRALASELARQDRWQAPAFERVLRLDRSQSRQVSPFRLAVAASLLLIAGASVTLIYQKASSNVPPPSQVALPNLLESFDTADPWQSPTAFLLDLSSAHSPPESAPAPSRNLNSPEPSNG